MESTAESWRVVVFTVQPFIPPMVESLLRERGHRLVGIDHRPRPAHPPHRRLSRRRPAGPPRPRRYRLQLPRPLGGDDRPHAPGPDRHRGFQLDHPRRRARRAAPRGDQRPRRAAAQAPRHERHRVGAALRRPDRLHGALHDAAAGRRRRSWRSGRSRYTDEDDGETILGRFMATIPVVLGEALAPHRRRRPWGAAAGGGDDALAGAVRGSVGSDRLGVAGGGDPSAGAQLWTGTRRGGRSGKSMGRRSA